MTNSILTSSDVLVLYSNIYLFSLFTILDHVVLEKRIFREKQVTFSEIFRIETQMFKPCKYSSRKKQMVAFNGLNILLNNLLIKFDI